MFAYGKQNPLMVCLVRLWEVEAPHISMHEAGADDVGLQSWDFAFAVNWSAFAWSDDATWDPEWECNILPKAYFFGDNRVVADGEWLT